MADALVERMAPEDLWELFQRVVPPAPERPQGGGARRRGNREVLAAIIFVATSGCTWNQLPPCFGLSGVTAFRRFTEWTEVRVWAKLHRLVLDELGSRGELDWSRCAIDSVSVRALKAGTLAGVVVTLAVLPGSSDSHSSQPAQSAQPTHKLVKHIFYGYDPEDPDLHMREALSWTSQDDNGPIDGTYAIQEQANDKGPWTPVGETKLFQGTQRGNEIDVPGGQLGDAIPVHGTLQQNGHRLHLDHDLGIETYDLYDSPSVAAAAGRQ